MNQMTTRCVLAGVLCLGFTALAQDSASAPPAVAPDQPPSTAPAEDKRIFGVIPNNRTTEASLPFHSLSAGQSPPKAPRTRPCIYELSLP